MGSGSKINSFIKPSNNSRYLTHRVLGGGRCRQTGLAASAGTGNTGNNQQQITVTKAECCCAMGAAWGSAENSANSTFGKSKSQYFKGQFVEFASLCERHCFAEYMA